MKSKLYSVKSQLGVPLGANWIRKKVPVQLKGHYRVQAHHHRQQQINKINVETAGQLVGVVGLPVVWLRGWLADRLAAQQSGQLAAGWWQKSQHKLL
jgi:hypothetical protein